MAAGKVVNLSRKSFGFHGVNGCRVEKSGEIGGGNGYRVESDCVDVDDGVVLFPPEKRRKVGYLDDDGPEPGQLDEEDYSHAPNISTSRWANDDDLDGSCHGVKGGEGKGLKGRRSSSPESGVTQKEGSDVSDGGYNNFDEYLQRDLVDEDCMDVDMSDGEGSFGGGLYPDEDEKDVLEAGVGENRNRDMLQGCESVFEYEKLGKISEGSYGIVYKAREKKTGEIVALKKLKLAKDSEGFPIHYLREINILLSFNHPSVVNVREVVVDDSVDGFDNIYMVMDYMEHDLKALMLARKQSFTVSEAKCLMLQLLEGMKYLHDNWVIHRDLKTSNLLVNNKGELKICDFGMSRQYGSPLNPYTALVVTLWYRAPELLLGVKEYSIAVDMWSVGCIMAEMLTSKPLFDGKTELEQLNKIFKTLGTPNDKIWPSYSELPGARANFVHQPHNLLRKRFPRTSFTGSPSLSDLGLDLLSKLLTYDPEKRITVDEALNHRWFQEAPLPMPKDYMPTFPAEKAALTR